MEISTNINSHIVPETYLKHFTDSSNQLWRYKIKSKFPSKIKQAFPSQVCYKPNYFRIENKNVLTSLDINDKDYIEKEAFKKYENNYNNILAKITSHSSCIPASEAPILINTLINIKARNSAIRKYYCKENVMPIYEEFLKELEKRWSRLEPFIKTDFKKFEEKIKGNIVDKEGIEDDMFLTSFSVAEVEKTNYRTTLICNQELFADRKEALIPLNNKNQ